MELATELVPFVSSFLLRLDEGEGILEGTGEIADSCGAAPCHPSGAPQWIRTPSCHSKIRLLKALDPVSIDLAASGSELWLRLWLSVARSGEGDPCHASFMFCECSVCT